MVEFFRSCPACKNRMCRRFIGPLADGSEPWYWYCEICDLTEMGGIEMPLTEWELEYLGWTSGKTDTERAH